MTKKKQGAADSGLGSLSLGQIREKTLRMREAMGPKRARRSLNALFGFPTSSDDEDGDHENTDNTGTQPQVQSRRWTGTEEEGAQQAVEESMKASSDEEEEARVEARRKKPLLGEGKKLRDVETRKFDVWDETSFLLDIVQFHKAMKVYPFANPEAMNEFVKYWVRPIDIPHPGLFIMEKIKHVEKSYEERDKRYHLQGKVLKSEEELVHYLGEHIWGSKFKKDDDVDDDDAIGVGDDVGVGNEEEGQQVGLEQIDLTKYPNLVKGLNRIPSDYHAIRDEAIVLMEESELEELDEQWEQLQKEKAELNEKQQGMITDLISAMQNAINSKTQDQ